MKVSLNNLENFSQEHIDFLAKIKKERSLKIFCQILILVGFCLFWEISAVTGVVDPFIFSSPSRIAKATFDLILDGSLFLHIGVTLSETLIGFFLSTIIGTLVAIILWFSTFLNKVLDPYIVVLNSLPKTALAPIIIVWAGNNVKAVIITAILTSVVVTTISVLSGFNEVDSGKIKLVKTLGGTKLQILTKVILPASFPIIISTLKINIGLSLVGVIVGEFLVAKNGLGYLIVYGSQIFKMDWVMMSVILLCILAAVMYKGILFIENKLQKKWYGKIV